MRHLFIRSGNRELGYNEAVSSENDFRLEIALAAADLGTHVYDINSGHVRLDLRAKRMFGLDLDEELNIDRFKQCLHPDDLTEVEAAIQKSLDPKCREHYTMEYRITPSGGSEERRIKATGIVFFSDDSDKATPTVMVGTVQDVTEQWRRSQELIEAKEAAEAANRAKTAFLAHMSHDIRTPLTAISGYAELAAQQLGPEQAELASEMRNACAHLLRTLDSVLRFARMEGKGLELDICTVNLSQEAHNAHALFAPFAHKKNLRIQFVEKAPQVCVQADLAAINRILANLLDNAIKFTDENKHITITLSKCDRFGHLEVADEGRGMSEEFRTKLFTPFSQEREKLDLALGGSGLGMAITKQMVDSMKGEIAVYSEEGKGTRLRISLPLSDDSSITQEHSKQTNINVQTCAESASSENNAKPRILACDDYANTLRVLELTLKDYPLDTAKNEQELIEKVDGHDVILLDINLHGRDVGKGLLKRLRKDPRSKDARIIAFTAHALPNQDEVFREQGFDGYLAKPFTREDLLDILDA